MWTSIKTTNMKQVRCLWTCICGCAYGWIAEDYVTYLYSVACAMLHSASVSSFRWAVGSWLVVAQLRMRDPFVGRGGSFVTHKEGSHCEQMSTQLSNSLFWVQRENLVVYSVGAQAWRSRQNGNYALCCTICCMYNVVVSLFFQWPLLNSLSPLAAWYFVMRHVLIVVRHMRDANTTFLKFNAVYDAHFATLIIHVDVHPFLPWHLNTDICDFFAISSKPF